MTRRDTIWTAVVWRMTERGTAERVPAVIVNRIMDAIDPGTWGEDHPLTWSCEVSARRCIEMMQDVLGPTWIVDQMATTRF